MNQDKTSKSRLLQVCGYIGLFGCIAAVVTDIIGIIVVEKHNPISETISALAITKYAWIQDLGLNLFALGLDSLCNRTIYVESQRRNLENRSFSLIFYLVSILS